MVNCDFNLCWVSDRTNEVKKLLISLIMLTEEVTDGQCNIVDAFNLFDEDDFAAYIKEYKITEVEFQRVTTYLG